MEQLRAAHESWIRSLGLLFMEQWLSLPFWESCCTPRTLSQHFTAAAAAMAVSRVLTRYSLSKRRERTGCRTQHTQCPVLLPAVCMVAPQAPALVTNPHSARARNRKQQCPEPDFWLQPLPKAWLTPGPAQLTSQGNTNSWALEQTSCAPSLITCV